MSDRPTVIDKIHHELERIAEKEGLTVPQLIEKWVEEWKAKNASEKAPTKISTQVQSMKEAG